MEVQRFMVYGFKLNDRGGPLGHERPAQCCCLYFNFKGGFSDHCNSTDEEGVPALPGPLMARGQNNSRPARCKANFDLSHWDFVFRTSRATLARLPLYCF